MKADRRPCWRISTAPEDLTEGLFGQLVLWIFELLPKLDQLGIVPDWDIRSRLYGSAPDYQVIPGVFDTVAEGSALPDRSVSLLALRLRHVSVLGSDWQALHALWHRHFSVPPRTTLRADQLGVPVGALGVHYRGTDKNLSTADTNPVSIDDMLCLVAEFLERQPQIPALFIAADEHAFVDAARQRFAGFPVFNLGPVPFHKGPDNSPDKADRALLDCVLLSRCAHLLKCSSALSGFAKVLNPLLSAHRVSASKVFFGGIPYFPDAYIPRLVGHSPRTRALLQRQFEGDWLDDESVAPHFRRPFVSMPRYTTVQVTVNMLKYAASLALGRPRKA